MISGRLRIHTHDGPLDVEAGEAFHVEPGHAKETLEATEMFEVSPTREARQVCEHLQGQLVGIDEEAAATRGG